MEKAVVYKTPTFTYLAKDYPKKKTYIASENKDFYA